MKMWEWCNCWFKDGCSLWIWIASFILSWKPVEAWSETWKLSAEHKERQCAKSFRCLKMWEALSLTKCSLTPVEKVKSFVAFFRFKRRFKGFLLENTIAFDVRNIRFNTIQDILTQISLNKTEILVD